MDPTQIKPGERASSLPVPAGPAATEPYQRAPTLMAGATAGSQGEVRVWGPIRRKLWIAVGLSSVALAITGVLSIVLHGHASLYCCFVQMITAGAFLSAITTLYRPCYVTTDDAGIGITTWKGSRALRWNEIKSAESLPLAPCEITLSLETGADVEINLTGYPPAIRKELLSLITARTGLCQHPVAEQLYLRSDNTLPVMCSISINGILVTRREEDRLVVEAVDRSAESVGIQVGDEVVGVGERSLKGLPGEQVVLALTWPAGALIKLRIFRPAMRATHDYWVRTPNPPGQPALTATAVRPGCPCNE